MVMSHVLPTILLRGLLPFLLVETALDLSDRIHHLRPQKQQEVTLDLAAIRKNTANNEECKMKNV